MLTSENLRKIEFDTYSCTSEGKPIEGTKIHHILIFNRTQISAEEVNSLINADTYAYDNRVVEVREGQLQYLHDK